MSDELYMIERHAAAGLVMSTYLLRTAGVAVWGMTQSVLGKVLRPDVEAGDVGIFSSPGSESSKPEYRKQFGQLQWLTLSPDSMDFGWYVDHFSQENTLRLSFGAIPYDIRYEPEGVGQGTVPGNRTPQGPRHESLEPKIVVDPSRKGTVTGVMVPIQQLWEAELPADSGPAATATSAG
ncbi:hypothetical protein [Streptomyces sp. NPDC056387]|uniref:hypothetical protein n=1 Tax=Streptomyces sp. NPDC056387 TaxID=3345803 RepID=UPI0035DE8CD6